MTRLLLALVSAALLRYAEATSYSYRTFATYPGFDYTGCTSTQASLNNVAYCRLYCSYVSGCTGYTFVGTSTSPNDDGTCYLRNCLKPTTLTEQRTTRAHYDLSCSSANKNAPKDARNQCNDKLVSGYATYPGYDVPGSNLASYSGQTLASCAKLCDSNSKCKSFTSIGSPNQSNFDCYLKTTSNPSSMTVKTSNYLETGLVGECDDFKRQVSANAEDVCEDQTTLAPSGAARLRQRDLFPSAKCSKPALTRCPGRVGEGECLDLQNDVESCGACGNVCSPSKLPHARYTGCSKGRCIVLSCLPGFHLEGDDCRPTKRHHGRALVHFET